MRWAQSWARAREIPSLSWTTLLSWKKSISAQLRILGKILWGFWVRSYQDPGQDPIRMPVGIVDLFRYPGTCNLIGSDWNSIIQVSSPNCNLKKPYRCIPLQDPYPYSTAGILSRILPISWQGFSTRVTVNFSPGTRSYYVQQNHSTYFSHEKSTTVAKW